jgi:hypothetical protein
VRVTWCPAAGHMLPPRYNYYVTKPAALGASVISGVMSNAIDALLLFFFLGLLCCIKFDVRNAAYFISTEELSGV